MSTTHGGPSGSNPPLYPGEEGHERAPVPSGQADERAGGPFSQSEPQTLLRPPQAPVNPPKETQAPSNDTPAEGGGLRLSRRAALIGAALTGVVGTLAAIGALSKHGNQTAPGAGPESEPTPDLSPGLDPSPSATVDLGSPNRNTATDTYPNIPGTRGEVEPIGSMNSTRIYPGDTYSARWNSDTVLKTNYLHLPDGLVSIEESMNRCLRAFAVMLTVPDDEFEAMLPRFVRTDVAKSAIRLIRNRTPAGMSSKDTNNLFVIFDTRRHPSKVEDWLTNVDGQADLVETISRDMPLNVGEDTNDFTYQAPTRMRLLSAGYYKAHEGEDLGALSADWQESHGLANLWFWLVQGDDGHALIEGFNVAIRNPSGDTTLINIYTSKQ